MLKRSLTIALIFGAFCTLIALGTWQVQRLAWKESLIAQATQRPNLPAMPLDQLVDESGLQPILGSYGDDDLAQALGDLAYRRASLTGEFFGQPVRVFTTLSDANGPLEGPGYWIMQGFQTNSHVVFINRGFIPFDLPLDVSVRDAPVGTISFEGLVRPDDLPDYFTPDPDYDDGLLYRRSVPQLMQATGVSVALPITIDMPTSMVADALPQAGETKFTFSNRHLEYAVTWYGLAAVLVIIVGVAWWRRRA